MDLPDPAAATAVATTLSEHRTALWAALGALGPVGRLLASWQGAAAVQARSALSAVTQRIQDAADALGQAAGTWDGLADDLQHAARLLRVVDTFSTGAAVWGVVSAVQLGLDPATDAVAGVEGGAAAAATVAARTALQAAVERLLTAAVEDRALLVLAQLYLRQVAVSVVQGEAEHAALDLAVLHRIRPADAVGSWLAGSLVPRRVPQALLPVPELVLLPAAVPDAFADRSTYELAVAAAGRWVAQDAVGARVSVEAGPEDTGVVLRVSGGGVAAAVEAETGRPTGYAYTSAELAGDPSLAQLVATVDDLVSPQTMFLDAPTRVVLE